MGGVHRYACCSSTAHLFCYWLKAGGGQITKRTCSIPNTRIFETWTCLLYSEILYQMLC